MSNLRTVFTLSLLLFVFLGTTLALPLNEGFDVPLFPPPGWQTFENGDGLYTWVHTVEGIYSHNVDGAAISCPENVTPGLRSVRWLVTPRLSVAAAENLAFWGRPDQSTAVGDSLYVLVSTTDSLPGSFTTVLAEYPISGTGGFGTSWTQKTVSLAAYEGQQIFVAFVHADEGVGGRQFAFDEVTGSEVLAPPYAATAPTPADLTHEVAASPNLAWTNDAVTTAIDLYFAQTYDSVANSMAAAKVIDNQNVSTYDPTGLVTAQNYYWKVVSRNAYGETHGHIWMFAVTGTTPLSGTYDIGGANPEFPNFTVAVGALYGRGVSGPVTFNVWDGDYDEQVRLIGAITNPNNDSVKFVDASGTARLRYTNGLASGDGILQMQGITNFIFDGIDVMCAGPDGDGTYKCLNIKSGSSDNIFRNAVWTGGGFSVTSVQYGVYLNGSPACNNNLFDNLDFFHHAIGFNTAGSAVNQHTGNVVQNCSFDDVEQALNISYTPDLHFRYNDVRVNAPDLSSGTMVNAGDLATGTSVYIYGNEFHDFVSAGSPVAIDANAGAGSIINLYNNFFYDLNWTGTGTTSFAGVDHSAGTVNCSFNSFRFDDVDASGTGGIRGYLISSSTATVIANIRNNIFYFAEAALPVSAIYGTTAETYEPDLLNYNAYYNNGGAAFLVFNVGADEYATVELLAAGEGLETNGVEGDPGFTSAADLHILETVGMVSNGGIPVDGIADDFDGDGRSVTPDIGADEYVFLAPPDDYAVTDIVNSPALLPELTLVNTMARVVNIGADAQTDVPVRLFYNGIQYAEVFVSLASDAVDTVDISWTTPAAQGPFTLEVQSFLDGDVNPDNDSATVALQIVGQPMHGSYDLGGGAVDYADFTAAATDLGLRGVDAAVTFNVFANTYNENVIIPVISGVSAVNTVTFVQADVARTPPEIVSATSPAVRLNGADYVTFDDIDIAVTVTGRAIEITGDADYNVFRNATVTGASVSGTSNYGVYVLGGGNDHNTFENLTISGGYWAVRASGASGTSDVGNEILNCTMLEGKYGVQSEYQTGLRIHDCDIQPGWASAATEIWGVNVGAHNAGDTTFVYNNAIHNLRVASGSTAHANGMATTAASARLRAYNNVIYDFQVTGGTSGVNALRVASGDAEYYYNSVRLNDVATTGGTSVGINGYYGTTGNGVVMNNIFMIEEADAACRAIFRSSGTLVSDYNAVYGTGAAYSMGRDGTTSYATLLDWQNATDDDDNSVEGDPGFVAVNDLHIQLTFDLVDGAATPLADITTDYDGDPRSVTPDIGADEYAPVAFAHDYGVISLVGVQTSYVSSLPYVIQADVQNYGSSNEIDVPVVLFFDGVPQDTTLLSLNAGARDTIDLNWTAPVTNFLIGDLEAQAFLPTDEYPDNDSALAEVTVVGPPMSGIYDVGGGANDFANFTEAVTALNLRGIDGEVIFDVFEGTYTESIVIGPIDGVSFTDQVIFRAHQDPLDDVVILTHGDAARVLYFDNASFVTFDGIAVTATNATNAAIELDNNSDFITLKNLAVTGRDSTVTITRGIKINFDGNDNCLIDNCTIRGAGRGITGEGGSGQSDNLEVKNCDISGTSYCVYVDDMHNARIHDNDLQPHGYASTSAYGVYVAGLTGGDTAYVYNNRIHNLRHTSLTGFAEVAGINSAPTSVAYVYNNFVWDWQTNGPDQSGIHTGTGTSYCYFNSIRMNVDADTNDFFGIEIAAGTCILQGNIISMPDVADTAYAIRRSGGTLLTSDYNCLYGTGATYFTGRDGNNEFVDLAGWQTLGRDLNSVAGDPGFLSDTDLHIDPLNTLCESAALAVPEVTTDIDGDPRNDPPDIGADEYEGIFPPDPVTDLTVYRDGVTDDVILRWTATAHANSYDVYAGTELGFPLEPGNLIGSTAATTFTHTGTVAAEPLRFYVVVASTAVPGSPAGQDRNVSNPSVR